MHRFCVASLEEIFSFFQGTPMPISFLKKIDDHPSPSERLQKILATRPYRYFKKIFSLIYSVAPVRATNFFLRLQQFNESTVFYEDGARINVDDCNKLAPPSTGASLVKIFTMSRAAHDNRFLK